MFGIRAQTVFTEPKKILITENNLAYSYKFQALWSVNRDDVIGKENCSSLPASNNVTIPPKPGNQLLLNQDRLSK